MVTCCWLDFRAAIFRVGLIKQAASLSTTSNRDQSTAAIASADSMDGSREQEVKASDDLADFDGDLDIAADVVAVADGDGSGAWEAELQELLEA